MSADPTVLDHDACRIVLDAIARLGRTDVEVLLLTAWERLSVAEIAVVRSDARHGRADRPPTSVEWLLSVQT